ncbi:MAG: Jag N-terminal domain-containing protein [Mailhella sp.]|nr:Jag N-terminal domain-containing protein [Mailhella sp.]
MNDSKEFLGKTLDAAIAEACAYYDVPREKLEIDIIEDAKTGIFGIVGARKAKIHARLATLPDFMQLGFSSPKAEREGRRSRKDRRREKPEEAAPVCVEQDQPAESGEMKLESPVLEKVEAFSAEPAAPAVEPAPAESASSADADKNEPAEEGESARGRRGRKERQPRQPRRESAPREEKSEKAEKAERVDDGSDMESTLPRIPLSELDQDMLSGTVRTVISTLVAPILDMPVEDVELSIEVGEDRVQVSVKSEDTGLLIGRDGQNLAAVQYLASRMITRAMGSQVRVQVDAGDYHVRQDSRLQELALSLAEKVKATGKVQTTRPLSAYQRRVIHLALQNDPEVQTRSSGEGALKHVVILKRKD